MADEITVKLTPAAWKMLMFAAKKHIKALEGDVKVLEPLAPETSKDVAKMIPFYTDIVQQVSKQTNIKIEI
jgi:hypothetical protein